MSEENVEVVRRGFDAWNRDDFEAFLAELHPDIEWHTALEGVAEGTVARGHVGMRQVWENQRAVFGRMETRIDELRDLGDSVLVLCHLKYIGRSSGAEIESELGMIVVIRDGLALTSHDYLSHAEALEAAGLRE